MFRVSPSITAAVVGLALLVSRVIGSAPDQTKAGRWLLYVSNERSNDVSVIDPNTNAVERTIRAGKRPRGIHAGPATGHVYVAVTGSPRSGPGADPDRAKNAAADKSADGIVPIDSATGQLGSILRVGSDPEQFAISPDEKFLVIANEDVAEASMWSLSSGAKIATLPVSEEPEGVAINPRNGDIYVTCEATGEVFVFRDQKTVARIKLSGRPRSVAFSGDGQLAYVPAEGGKGVTVVDTRDFHIVKTIEIGGVDVLPMCAISDPRNARVYISTGRGNSVAVIDMETNTLLATIAVGRRPWGIVLSPDGRTLFSANGGSDDVSVVDVVNLRELRRIPVGHGPWGVAITNGRKL